jgi:RNA polymerase sigma-70 factor (ECF subfamily)
MIGPTSRGWLPSGEVNHVTGEIPMSWRAQCCILAVLPALASLAMAGDASDEEVKKFEGTWKFVSLESDGQEAPADVIATWRWVFRGKEITMGDPAQGGAKASFTVDPSQSPRALDMTALDGNEKGKMFKCIYELKGEHLKICLPEGKQAEADRPRPEEFGGGKGLSLIVLERIKPE